MENNTDSIILNLAVDEESKSQFNGIAQWARLNAIVGFASLGISIVATIIASIKLNAYEAGVSAGSLFVLFISTIISLLLNITLINAATNIKKAIDGTDQFLFGVGLSKLATYFKIVGILTILVLVIMVLLALFGIIAGAASAF